MSTDPSSQEIHKPELDNPNKPVKNLPESELPIKPLTIEEIEEAAKKRVSRIDKEFAEGFAFIKNKEKSISMFGSTRAAPDSAHYQQAYRLAKRFAELGYTVLTGGGPGIMEAANKGAFEGKGHSLGLGIKLAHAQATNPYLTDKVEFYYFFTRKVMLSFAAEAYIFFPGGFGTLDEFFEIVTLVQTNKIQRVPIICVGEDYWKPLQNFVYEQIYQKHNAILKDEMNLYTITDNEDEIVEIVKKVPIRNGVRYVEQQ